MGLFLFSRPKVEDPVEPGFTYRRMVAMGVTETAHVVAVTPDNRNIPHVRYVVRNDLGAAPRLVKPVGDQRTLSMESFQRLFQERVAV